jgi:hypothetical protein
VRRLRVVLAVTCLGVLASGTATAAVRINHAAHYSPLESAGFFGPTAATDRFLGPFGGPDSQQLMHPLDGHVTRWVFALTNTGGDAVTVDSVKPIGVSGTTQWSIYKVVPGGYLSGVPAVYNDLPARVSAGGSIRLRVSVQPADCAKGQRLEFDGVDVAWHALGFHHETYIANDENVVYCPSTTSKREWLR